MLLVPLECEPGSQGEQVVAAIVTLLVLEPAPQSRQSPDCALGANFPGPHFRHSAPSKLYSPARQNRHAVRS